MKNEFNKVEWAYIDEWAKKLKAANILGGKCTMCGEDHLHLMNFHHVDKSTKEYKMPHVLQLRWSLIEAELQKCILLCYNCHREVHANEEKADIAHFITRKHNKQLILDTINKHECEHCGYNKENQALEFHHIDSNTKIFDISKMMQQSKRRWKNSNEIPKELLQEIDKCILVCSNCHMDIHFDKDRFKLFENEILEKSNNIKEVQRKISREKVLELISLGYKQCEIIEQLNCSKGAISGIFKEFSMTSKRNVFDKEKLIEMIKNNCKATEVLKEINCTEQTFYFYKKKLKLDKDKNSL